MKSSVILTIETYFLNFLNESLINGENKKCINRKIASELFVLSFCHQLLIKNIKSTKRNIFYMNVKLFGHQSYLDFIIESISKKLGLSRVELNIEASNRSIVYGKILLNHNICNSINCLSSNSGVSLPSGFTFSSDDLKLIKFILVIEKDATFQQLIKRNFCEIFSPCILITSKGFPDLNCRFLLNEIRNTGRKIHIYCLTDADPYGLAIYCTYKYGSTKISLLNSSHEKLCCPDLKLIGLLATDIEKYQFQRNELLSLSLNDNKMLKKIQTKEFYSTDPIIKNQTECFLRLQLKAEIQHLHFLESDYLLKEYLYKRLIDNGIVPTVQL